MKMADEKQICVHFKFGYCKFRANCRFSHVDIICDDSTDCDIGNCDRRHPRECKYFTSYGRCKFGSFCRYSHVKSKVIADHEELKECNKKLFEMNSKFEKQLEEYKAKLEDLEKKIVTSNQMFSDIEKKYQAISNIQPTSPLPHDSGLDCLENSEVVDHDHTMYDYCDDVNETVEESIANSSESEAVGCVACDCELESVGQLCELMRPLKKG